jgi:hypothetical protein
MSQPGDTPSASWRSRPQGRLRPENVCIYALEPAVEAGALVIVLECRQGGKLCVRRFGEDARAVGRALLVVAYAMVEEPSLAERLFMEGEGES